MSRLSPILIKNWFRTIFSINLISLVLCSVLFSALFLENTQQLIDSRARRLWAEFFVWKRKLGAKYERNSLRRTIGKGLTRASAHTHTLTRPFRSTVRSLHASSFLSLVFICCSSVVHRLLDSSDCFSEQKMDSSEPSNVQAELMLRSVNKMMTEVRYYKEEIAKKKGKLWMATTGDNWDVVFLGISICFDWQTNLMFFLPKLVAQLFSVIVSRKCVQIHAHPRIDHSRPIQRNDSEDGGKDQEDGIGDQNRIGTMPSKVLNQEFFIHTHTLYVSVCLTLSSFNPFLLSSNPSFCSNSCQSISFMTTCNYLTSI